MALYITPEQTALSAGAMAHAFTTLALRQACAVRCLAPSRPANGRTARKTAEPPALAAHLQVHADK